MQSSSTAQEEKSTVDRFQVTNNDASVGEKATVDSVKSEYGIAGVTYTPYRRNKREPRPNALCWCGSGRKYKVCHGANG